MASFITAASLGSTEFWCLSRDIFPGELCEEPERRGREQADVWNKQGQEPLARSKEGRKQLDLPAASLPFHFFPRSGLKGCELGMGKKTFVPRLSEDHYHQTPLTSAHLSFSLV